MFEPFCSLGIEVWVCSFAPQSWKQLFVRYSLVRQVAPQVVRLSCAQIGGGTNFRTPFQRCQSQRTKQGSPLVDMDLRAQITGTRRQGHGHKLGHRPRQRPGLWHGLRHGHGTDNLAEASNQSNDVLLEARGQRIDIIFENGAE